MIIKTLELQNFRNYKSLKIDLNKKTNIIYGKNGEGKTNILESIYLLCFLSSHRTISSDSLIKTNEEKAKIKGKLIKEMPYNLEIDLTKTKKEVKIDDKVVNKLSDYIEKMNVIIFSSEDLNLIKGSPKERRRYFDLELTKLSINYYSVLNDYNKLLKIRNEYLKELNQNMNVDLNYFHILTDYLVNKSIFIYQMRNKLVEKLNKILNPIYKEISGIKGFNIKYLPSVELENFDKENIKEKLEDAFNNNLEKEIRLKSTLYGPHRDDFLFNIEDNSLKDFGSQGQQRSAALSLKFAEIDLFEEETGEKPVLLLDDVLSELDENRRSKLLEMSSSLQTVITCTEFEEKVSCTRFRVKNGNIS